jgi:outer membrane protein assembly factor BamB
MRAFRSTGLGLGLMLAFAATYFAAPAAAATPCTAGNTTGAWPSYGHDLSNTRTQPVPQGLGPDAVGNLTPAWSFATDDNSGFNTTPVVYSGCVYIGSAGGTVYAFDASNGHVVWQRKLDATKAGAGGVIVGAPTVNGRAIIYLVNQDGAPYAIALDRVTGAQIWRSPQFASGTPNAIQGYYTNASPIVANGLVVAGYSGPEGDSTGNGGFTLINASTGAIVKTTPTIPPADQAKGYAGGGMWSTPAYDPATKYMYWGSGNPNSKQLEHENVNAILKIDLNRSHATFGEIVDRYHGNVDQYSKELQTLSHTPVCAATDQDAAVFPLDDPACGQIDLDFGASANLFTESDGTKVVGDLQKSGVYHVARTADMKPAWTALMGLSCQTCNAASTSFDGTSVEGVGTPEGLMFSLNRDTGSTNWAFPIPDGIHYQSTSVADGVVWTEDNTGSLLAFDAKTGDPLVHQSIAADSQTASPNLTSAGVAIAEHMVFAAAGGGGYSTTTGYLVAYRAGG